VPILVKAASIQIEAGIVAFFQRFQGPRGDGLSACLPDVVRG